MSVTGWQAPRHTGTMLAAVGFLAGAAGGALMASSEGEALARQDQLDRVVTLDSGGALAGVAIAVVCLLAAAAAWAVPARVGGVVVTASFGLVLLFSLGDSRADDDLQPGVPVSLGEGGETLLIAAGLLLAGTAAGLASFLWTGRDPLRTGGGGGGRSIASLAMGIAGLLLVPLAAPAVAAGLLTLADPLGEGRRRALTGVALGTLSLVGWSAGALAAALVATP